MEIATHSAEIKQAMQNDLSTLGMVAMPEDVTMDFPELFLQLWAMLCASLLKERDFSKFAVGLPRGHAKTLVLKLLVLFAILFTKKKFILVVCASEPLAKNILADVADMLDSPNIQALFGNWRFGMEVDRAELKKFVFNGRPIIIAAAGQGTSIRGLQLKNSRPDLMIFDDAQTRDCAQSLAESKNFQTWFLGTALKAKSPTGCTFIYVGNMYPDIELKPATPTTEPVYTCMLRNLQKSKYWISFIVGAILSDGTALWEQLQPLEQLLEEFENDKTLGSPETFYAEVMNDPQASSLGSIDFSKVQLFTPTPESFHLGNFIIIDPSGSKKTSDDTAISYFEMHEAGDRVRRVMQKVVKKRLDPRQTIEEALTIAIQKGCTLIGVETVAYQATLIFWFVQVCETLGIKGIEFVPLNPGGRSKNVRICNWFKELEAGECLLSAEAYAVVAEQAGIFDRMRTNNKDDVLDTGAYSQDMVRDYSGFMTMQGAGAQVLNSEFNNLKGPDAYY